MASNSNSSSSSSSASSSLNRINNIANHISPPMASVSSFPADTVPQAPEDALFGLARAYKADESPLKVDLVCDLTVFPNRGNGLDDTLWCNQLITLFF